MSKDPIEGERNFKSLDQILVRESTTRKVLRGTKVISIFIKKVIGSSSLGTGDGTTGTRG